MTTLYVIPAKAGIQSFPYTTRRFFITLVLQNDNISEYGEKGIRSHISSQMSDFIAIPHQII